MRLETLTWREVHDYVASNRRMIVPIGTCEQHGPHLPLNTDTLVAEALAAYLSEETGIVVAPTLNYGVNLPCDRVYAGTCSTNRELLRDFLASLLEWWKSQGFERFYLLSAHGDPFHLEALRTVDPQGVRVLELYGCDMTGVLTKQKGCKHAGEVETSIMMYLWPDTVRQAMIEDFETPFEEFRPYLMHEKTGPVEGSPGNQGYPSAASPEKGRELFARMTAYALKWLLEDLRGSMD